MAVQRPDSLAPPRGQIYLLPTTTTELRLLSERLLDSVAELIDVLARTFLEECPNPHAVPVSLYFLWVCQWTGNP